MNAIGVMKNCAMGWLLGWVVFAAGCDDSGDRPAAVDAAVVDAMGDAAVVGWVRFVEPLGEAVIGGERDLDGDLGNGVQVEVVVAAGGSDDGRVVFRSGERVGEAPLIEGRAVAVVSLPALDEGRVRISAEITSGGRVVADEIVVVVRVLTCGLSVEPLPGGVGCDLGPGDDLDGERPGVQFEVVARSDCAVVEVVAGGVARNVAVVDGVARIGLSVPAGASEVRFTAMGAGAQAAVVGPVVYEARTVAPRVGLDLRAGLATVRGLGAGVVEGGRVFWVIEGESDGLDAGARVRVVFEPALAEAPSEARVDGEGRFEVEVGLPIGAAWAGTVAVSAVDECGTASAVVGYELRLDAVTPRLRIAAPVEGARVTLADDLDAGRAGIQVGFAVEVEDARAVELHGDYRVSVACGAPGEAAVDRAQGAGDAVMRSALPGGVVVATFGAEERGEVVCVPVAESAPNAAVGEAVRVVVVPEAPRFVVEAPVGGCATGAVEVRGRGALLDGNEAALGVVATPADGGAARASVALVGLGGEEYAVMLADLPEGRWSLGVSGTVFGRVPVVVEPAVVEVVVDRSAPTVRFERPEAPFGVDVDPAMAGFQFAPRVEVCGAGGQVLAVVVEPAVAGPFEVVVPAGECAVVDLPVLTAPLGGVRWVATVADACGNVGEGERRSGIDPARVSAVITSPVAGAAVGVGLDVDRGAAGCQFEVMGLVSGPGAEAAIEVCTGVDQGRPAVGCAVSGASRGACLVVGVVEAGTVVRCPVTLVDGAHALTLAVDEGALVSAAVPVRVDCTGPVVEALSVDDGGDGCVNRAERLNAGEAGENARVRVRFVMAGIEGDAAVRVRTEAGLDLGGALAGAGEVVVSLPPGEHRLFLRGQDAAGNALVEPGRVVVVRVDTGVPAPEVIGLAEGACVAAADDLDAGEAGARVALRVVAGGEAGEAVRAGVRVDGVAVAEAAGADALVIPLTLAEGERGVEVTVSDGCGNAASVMRRVVVDTVAPAPLLLGIEDGAVLGPGDDADAAAGFQLDVAVGFVAPEPGLAVQIGALDAAGEAVPVPTEPSPLVVVDGDPVPARLTLAGGARALVAQAVDGCGNEGRSEVVPIRLDLPGCPSRVTAPLGVIAGAGGAGVGVTVAVEGRVDLTDLDCIGARVVLLRDGVAVGGEVMVTDEGAVRFDGVALGRGAQTLALRVGPVRGVTLDSPAAAVTVDVEAPVVVITRPAGPEPARLLADDRPDLPGQQVAISAAVSEAVIDSPRTAHLSLDGVEVAARPAPGAGVDFADVTVPPGRHRFEVCVRDAAGQVGCAAREVDADGSAPGVIVAEVEIIDRRATEVVLRFAAPGDDGDAGPVAEYVLRRAEVAFATEADWDAAAASEVVVPATVGPGEVEEVVIRGPGPTLADGFALDRLHHFALRARDDAGRLGALADGVVNLRMAMDQGVIAARGGAWEAGDLINTTAPVIGVGDFDGDGFDDLLVTATQSASATGAALVFGGAVPETRALSLVAGMSDAFFGVAAAAAGDLNGDGAPDVAVQGYRAGFAGVAVALYFGCAQAPCDRAALAAPDALVESVGGRFTNSLAGLGDAWVGDEAGVDDLLVGGALGGEATAFVVAGRSVWPALPGSVTVGDGAGDLGAGVAVLSVPEGPAAVYAAGIGDRDGDGFAEIALSAGPAINAVYVFAGGFDEAVAYAPGDPRTVRLVDPCAQAGATFGSALAGGVDLDGDGRPDFVVGNRANKRLVVFDADLAPLDCFGRTPAQFGRVFDLVGDIDGDGAVDLAATHGDAAVVEASVFYNDGLGRFGVGGVVSPRIAHVRLDRPARRKLGVAGAGDFDGDGRADLAAVVLSAGGEMTWVVYR